MIFIGFHLDQDLKNELLDNFENDTCFVENIVDFMDALKK